MNVRSPLKLTKRCRLFAVALVVLAGTSSCGQIGPLYLPDQDGAKSEQDESQAQDSESVEKKVGEENDGENPGSL